ncbi:MAG: aminoacyl-histidine dipeptidase [Rikenellaceae bacterium]
MKQISELEPSLVWGLFHSITKIPRPSGKEQKIIAWLIDFAKSHSLDYKVDKVGNVLISAPATAGREQTPAVTLQAHVDMVCEKDSDVEFDFESDPIRTRIEGEWVTAAGTTLGADCGIGMAAALAALIDPSYEHGPLAALFTVNEEVGLTGAFELGEGMISGDILLNLDSEEEGEICIGCAGGIDTVATFHFEKSREPKDFSFFRIDISGLRGGHSGADIHLGLANANKILARVLSDAQHSFGMQLSYAHGGNLRNAIPREAYAIFGIPTRYEEEFKQSLELFEADIKDEYAAIEPNITISLSEMPAVEVIDKQTQLGVIYSLLGVANGVISLSTVMEDLVESSTNLASIRFKENNSIEVVTSQRSSKQSAKTYVMQMVEATFTLAGADVTHSDGYPGWSPNPESEILALAKSSYESLFGSQPSVTAIHAGLECGLFLESYPDLDMISFGPTLSGVHSPDERLHIESVTKFWDFLKDILSKI